LEDDTDKSSPSSTNGKDWELGDYLFITQILPEPIVANLQAMATNSQYLAEEA